MLEPLTVPAAYARSVNIPESYQDPLNPDTEPFPVGELRRDEYLVNTPFGIVVRNSKFVEHTASEFEAAVLEDLRSIKAKLGIP